MQTALTIKSQWHIIDFCHKLETRRKLKNITRVILCIILIFIMIGAGCARTVTSTEIQTETIPVTVPLTTTLTSNITIIKDFTTTVVTGYPYPVTILPNIQSSPIVINTVSVSNASWYSVTFSITATMINPVVTGSIAVMSPGTTAWVQIYTTGDSDSAPQYETGNVTAATINAPLPFRSYRLMIGTFGSVALEQVLANINLVYFR